MYILFAVILRDACVVQIEALESRLDKEPTSDTGAGIADHTAQVCTCTCTYMYHYMCAMQYVCEEIYMYM